MSNHLERFQEAFDSLKVQLDIHQKLLEKLRELVELQACDIRLWAIPADCEDECNEEFEYIQQQLRRLHKALEVASTEEIHEIICEYQKEIAEANL